MDRDGDGYAEAVVQEAGPGTRYLYRLTQNSGEVNDRPDPASRYQPEGVHGPSQVVAQPVTHIDGRGAPRGKALRAARAEGGGRVWRDYVFYELHVGTFTAEGTFAAMHAELGRLAKLGITAIELMPVAQFPGTRNWGYDGVFPFAVQNSYGGPSALRALVEGMHSQGLSAVLDVVYNHLGPEGNYLAEFGPYFTSRYTTPWGAALNFDAADSDPVRQFFIENALYWLDGIGFDALRLDAIHGIVDTSAYPFLAELADRVAELAAERQRRLYLIAESDLNDGRVLRPTAAGGLGMQAQWNDDFHHALHVLVTGERQGYYADFGRVQALAAAMRDNFVYAGQYSHYRRRRHGATASNFAPDRFVVFAQNHDQVGNRAGGDRLAARLSPAELRLIAGVVILSPATPLLFMGEEFGAASPFPYFVSHGDADLIEAVRRGRREEFEAFKWEGEVPDPQAEATFLSAKLPPHRDAKMAGWYRKLLRLRRHLVRGQTSDGRGAPRGQAARPACGEVQPERAWSCEQPAVVSWQPSAQAFIVAHFGDAPAQAAIAWPEGRWRRRLHSSGDAGEAAGGGSDGGDEIDSTGRVEFSLAAYGFSVYLRAEKAAGEHPPAARI